MVPCNKLHQCDILIRSIGHNVSVFILYYLYYATTKSLHKKIEPIRITKLKHPPPRHKTTKP